MKKSSAFSYTLQRMRAVTSSSSSSSSSFSYPSPSATPRPSQPSRFEWDDLIEILKTYAKEAKPDMNQLVKDIQKKVIRKQRSPLLDRTRVIQLALIGMDQLVREQKQEPHYKIIYEWIPTFIDLFPFDMEAKEEEQPRLAHDISTTLYSLSKILRRGRTTIKQVFGSKINAIITLAARLAKNAKANAQDLSNTALALGYFAHADLISSDMRFEITSTLLTLTSGLAKDKKANAQNLANTILALGYFAKDGLIPHHFTPGVTPLLISLASRLAKMQETNAQALANTTLALGYFAHADLISSDIQLESISNLLALTSRLAKDEKSNAQALANTILALGYFAKAGLIPHHSAEGVTPLLLSLVNRLEKEQEANAQDLANTILALGYFAQTGLIHFDTDQIKRMTPLLLKLVGQLVKKEEATTQSLAYTIWSLGVWIARARLSQSDFNPASMNNIIFSLSEKFFGMTCDKKMDIIIEGQMIANAFGYAMLPLPEKLKKRVIATTPKSSDFHIAVSKALQSKHINVENESFQEGFFVDMYFSDTQPPTIIELDGARHQKYKQQVRDLLRDKVLAKKFRLVRIPLGSETFQKLQADAIANYIIQLIRCPNALEELQSHSFTPLTTTESQNEAKDQKQQNKKEKRARQKQRRTEQQQKEQKEKSEQTAQKQACRDVLKVLLSNAIREKGTSCGCCRISVSETDQELALEALLPFTTLAQLRNPSYQTAFQKTIESALLPNRDTSWIYRLLGHSFYTIDKDYLLKTLHECFSHSPLMTFIPSSVNVNA